MPQSKLRHAIYVRIKRTHPDWTAEKIRAEVTRLEGSHTVHKRIEKSKEATSMKGSHSKVIDISPQAIPNLSSFGILYRKAKDDFTLVYLAGDKIRPLRSLRTGIENGIPELSGLRIIREKTHIDPQLVEKEADAL